MFKPYTGESPQESITEESSEFEDQEEIIQWENFLWYANKVLQNGKAIQRYLIKLKNYPFEDARWIQGTQFKDNTNLVNDYNDSLE